MGGVSYETHQPGTTKGQSAQTECPKAKRHRRGAEWNECERVGKVAMIVEIEQGIGGGADKGIKIGSHPRNGATQGRLTLQFCVGARLRGGCTCQGLRD